MSAPTCAQANPNSSPGSPYCAPGATLIAPIAHGVATPGKESLAPATQSGLRVVGHRIEENPSTLKNAQSGAEDSKTKAYASIAAALGMNWWQIYRFCRKHKRPPVLPCVIGAMANIKKAKVLTRRLKLRRALARGNAKRMERYRTNPLFRAAWLKRMRASHHRNKHNGKRRESQRRYRDRHKNDPVFRIRSAIRGRMQSAFRRAFTRKSQHTNQLIGCSPVQLKEWLESKFERGMSWDNYGTEWHIDHIIPLSSFNLKDPKQVILGCHFSNLRPMWAEGNLSKGAKIMHPQLPLPLPYAKAA